MAIFEGEPDGNAPVIPYHHDPWRMPDDGGDDGDGGDGGNGGNDDYIIIDPAG